MAGFRSLTRVTQNASLCVALCIAAGCGTAKDNGRREVETSHQAMNPPPAARSDAPAAAAHETATPAAVLTGAEALGDWRSDAPGVRRKITLADLPAAYATPSARNHPDVVDPPKGASPQVPHGFTVTRFAAELSAPRMLRTAPNGDVFVAESKSDRVRVLRDADGDGRAEKSAIFADDLEQPFGIAFYPPGPTPTHVYVANTDSVVRFAYSPGDLRARAAPETIVANLPSGGLLEGGGHWTRDVVFSLDAKRMFVSVGSRSNVDDDKDEARRARIFEYTPDGQNERVYAYGIRNPVGLAIEPTTGELWASVNERDGLGDDLVPDYITRVTEHGFYGWPWFYLGDHQDPHHPGKRPELKGKVLVPDVLLPSHSASLGMTFYTGSQFPAAFRGQRSPRCMVRGIDGTAPATKSSECRSFAANLQRLNTSIS